MSNLVEVGSLEYQECVIVFWRGDYKMYRIETNFMADVWGIVHEWINLANVYDKAVIEWNGKTITIDKNSEFPIIE